VSKITIQTGSPKFPVTETLYGLFFEDINRSGDSGLYPEMIRNRTFEDSLIPDECTAADPNLEAFVSPSGWRGEFNHGEGLPDWPENNKTPYTSIPAWYADRAKMTLDDKDVLNANRRVSLKVEFCDGGCVYNTGYMGIPVKAGEASLFYMFAKACRDSEVLVRLTSASGLKVYAQKSFTVKSNGYARYDAALVSSGDDTDARLMIVAPKGFTLHLGFISLMPSDTYNGHGLRTDLVEKLADLKPAFMRFPGGCIVEGFTVTSALKFSNMIGPMWERPTNWNLWAYRTTNGLGYHEWLQLCEDLNMKKMWVFNCGMTCQARNMIPFLGKDLENALQEAIDAIEYATAPVGTKWGDLRAAAGHPAPFGMDYVEIGNENHGPVYNERYEMCYKELKKRYPGITFISNTHTEQDGLPTEIADEHFYSTPEFFAENIHKYDSYDRNGPKIFVGEYAVTSGKPGKLVAALGEAMFLMGMEKNQDIVELASYAPLFENVSFYNWYPNLICFDNSRSYGIPSWHMLKLMGANRGTSFVDAQTDAKQLFKYLSGIFGVQSASAFSFKNAKIDGVPAPVSHELLGGVEEKDGVYTTFGKHVDTSRARGPMAGRNLDNATRILFGEEAKEAATFEVSVNFTGELSLQVLVSKMNFRRDTSDWNFMNARGFDWKIVDGVSSVFEDRFYSIIKYGEDVELKLENGWHDFKVVTFKGGYDCYVDGVKVQTANLPSYPAFEAVADVSDSEVIVKIVNFTGEDNALEVNLDCDVASDYTAQVLAGDPDAENSLNDPENVAIVEKALSGAGKTFTYNAPAYSLSVLRLKK